MRLEIFMAITTWQEQVFPNATATSKMKHLQEEVKEVLHELEQPKVSTSKLLEEYADCLFLLYGAVNSSGFSYDDMQLALIDKFEKNLQRKWGEPDADGIVKHIKDDTCPHVSYSIKTLYPVMLFSCNGCGAEINPLEPNQQTELPQK